MLISPTKGADWEIYKKDIITVVCVAEYAKFDCISLVWTALVARTWRVCTATFSRPPGRPENSSAPWVMHTIQLVPCSLFVSIAASLHVPSWWVHPYPNSRAYNHFMYRVCLFPPEDSEGVLSDIISSRIESRNASPCPQSRTRVHHSYFFAFFYHRKAKASKEKASMTMLNRMSSLARSSQIRRR